MGPMHTHAWPCGHSHLSRVSIRKDQHSKGFLVLPWENLTAVREYLIQGLVGVGVTEGEGSITSELLSEFMLLEL